MTLEFLTPDWPAPEQVRALITTRRGGVSQGVYADLNLAGHVGDDPRAVEENRQRLVVAGGLPDVPFWLNQVHGCEVVDAQKRAPGCHADGVYANRPGRVCAVLTADCLPLLLTAQTGREVCAVHAGWRGLSQGVIEQAVTRFKSPIHCLMVWMGPAIGASAFEVGDEVRQAFMSQNQEDARAFRSSRPGHWWADLYHLARLRLNRLGVGFVGGGGDCTATDRERFYSYRRDGVTGRMASLIWFDESAW
jgi:YfiH family protein